MNRLNQIILLVAICFHTVSANAEWLSVYALPDDAQDARLVCERKIASYKTSRHQSSEALGYVKRVLKSGPRGQEQYTLFLYKKGSTASVGAFELNRNSSTCRLSANFARGNSWAGFDQPAQRSIASIKPR